MSKTRRTIVLLGALLAALGIGCDAPKPPAESGSGSASTSSATPNASLDAALAEADPFLRVQKLAQVLPTLRPEVVPEVEHRLVTSRAGLYGAETELLLRFWASHDPYRATYWASGLINNPYRIAAVQIAVETWAGIDPKAALEGISSIDFATDTARAAKVALVRGWFHKDRAGLEQYIHGLEVSPERETALLLYAVALAQAEGTDALIRWADAIPDEDEGYKRAAYYKVVTALAGIDSQAAQRWCDTHCDGPYGMVEMRSVIAFARLRQGDSGDAILEWLLQSPQLESYDETLVSTYGLWANRDREAALAWMQQKVAGEPQPGIPLLYGQYALHLAASSPAEALKWAGRVENDADREDMLVRIARHWRRQDAAAAEAWLAQSALPASARESARNLELLDNLPGSNDSNTL